MKPALRTSFFLFLSLLCAIAATAQKAASDASPYYAWYQNQKTTFQLDHTKILINTAGPQTVEAVTATIKALTDQVNPINPADIIADHRGTILRLKTPLEEKALTALLNQLRTQPGVLFANPFLIYKDGSAQGITNRFFVRLKQPSDLHLLQAEIDKRGCTILKQDAYTPTIYHLEVTPQAGGNALDVANALHETGQFLWTEADFIKLLKKLDATETRLPAPAANPQPAAAVLPNDQHLNSQWALRNTATNVTPNGTADADMDVMEAWNTTSGNPYVRIAIIDEGVQLNHPDLQANLVTGYDATGQGSAGGPKSGDDHGTKCAGIAAAVGNNTVGVAGVAYKCKIVPVRIAYSGSDGHWVTSSAWMADAINWSWNQGKADVLSNSWHGGYGSSLVGDAITNATTQGRGGKGSPVLCAAGNDNNTSIVHPGNLPQSICVAASSPCDERKSTASCDGESFWGSCYGTELDVAAPGVLIYTTTLTSTYTGFMNGTSAATPNAAGVMALILSANLSLTYTQARAILEKNCDKVGPYTYNNIIGVSNGSWTNQMGHGRVNAALAVQEANSTICANAIDLRCGTTVATTTVGGTNAINQYSCIAWKEDGPEKIYRVVLNKPGTIKATLSNNTADLDLWLLSSCNPNSCVAYNGSALTAANLAAGTYYLIVDGFESAQGTFRLTLDCFDSDEYCIPGYTNSCSTGGHIGRFKVNTLSNNTLGCAGFNANNYTYYGTSSNHTTELADDKTYSISVTPGSVAQYFGVWCDWNNDDEFDGTGEFLMATGLVDGFDTATANFTVPFSYGYGPRRLRVRSSNTAFAAADYCAVRSSGETEDYTIYHIPAACVPRITNPCTSGDYIDDVTFNTISRDNTGCSSTWQNYISVVPFGSTLTTTVESSRTYPLTVGVGPRAQNVAVWIDYNDDDIFTSGVEFIGTKAVAANGTATFTVTIPSSSAYAGQRRMRIRSTYSTTAFANTSACTNTTYGETEDYTITILKPTITLGTFSSTTRCIGNSYSVPFTATGTYNAGNTYRVQLSSATGSFTSPIYIGSGNTSPISINIPSNTPPGAAYKIRVVSTNPVVTGNSSSSFAIKNPPAAPTTTSQERCGKGSVTLSASGASAPNYRWYTSQITRMPISGATGPTYTTPTLSATTTYYVSIHDGCESDLVPVTATIKTVPTVSSFSPTSGPVGTLVQITGTGFDAATQVAFGTTLATSKTFISSTRIDATVPAGATTSQIRLNRDGCIGSSTTNFTVGTATGPSIASLTLINPTTEADVITMTNGMTINKTSFPSSAINIRANTSGTPIGSVKFQTTNSPSTLR